jgi:hypothetical protein
MARLEFNVFAVLFDAYTTYLYVPTGMFIVTGNRSYRPKLGDVFAETKK